MTQMFKTAALALAAPGLLAAAPAIAAPAFDYAAPAVHAASWTEASNADRHRRYRDYERSRYNDYGYQQQRYYGEPVYNNTRVWQGNDGRYYCRRSNGTTGLLIGGAAGALLGREIAGRGGDRTLGAILGAAGGALLGRSIDKSSSRCR